MISVGLSESHRKVYNELKVQDSLYTVVSKKPNGLSKIRVIGSVLDCLQAPNETAEVIKLISSNEIKMISLTIKEGNYHFNNSFTKLNVEDAQIQYDLLTATGPTRLPRTPVGMLVAGLYERYKLRGKPVSVLCIDNLIRGGEISRVMVETFAVHRFPMDTGFHLWLASNVFYPNSMCDRICLTDPLPDSIALQQIAGIRDKALVTTESFKDWVLEKWMGDKPEGMEEAGVRFVSSSVPYENLKIRLNYGTRLSVAIMSYALGYVKFEDALRDPTVTHFMKAYMDEAANGLGSEMPKDVNLEEYKSHLVIRMSTKQLKYMTRRVAEDASTKLKMDWKPVLESLDPAAPTKVIGLAIAAWVHLLAATPIVKAKGFHPLSDNMLDKLEPVANRLVDSASTKDAQHAALEFLNLIFGSDAGFVQKLSPAVVKALQAIQSKGLREAITAIC